MGLFSKIKNFFTKPKKKTTTTKKASSSKKTTASSSLKGTPAYLPNKNKQPAIKPINNAPYSNKEVASRQQYNRQALQQTAKVNTLKAVGQARRTQAAAKPTANLIVTKPKAPTRVTAVNAKPFQSPLEKKSPANKLITPDFTVDNPITLFKSVTNPVQNQAMQEQKEQLKFLKQQKQTVDASAVFSREYREEVAKKYEQAKEDLLYYNGVAHNMGRSLDELKPKLRQTYQVDTLSSLTSHGVDRASNAGTLQVVYIRRDKDYIMTTKTGYGAQEVSANYLQGLRPQDQVVLYDPITSKFYRYETDTKESAPVRAKMDALASKQQAVYNKLNKNTYNNIKAAENYKKTMEYLSDKMYSGTATQKDYEAFNEYKKRYDNLVGSEDYTKASIEYNQAMSVIKELQKEYDAEQQVYNQFGFSDLVVNNDFANKMQENVNKVNKARKEYEAASSNYSDMMSDSQINSVADALRRFVGNTSFVTDEHGIRQAKFLGDLDLGDFKRLGMNLYAAFKQTFIKPISFIGKNLTLDDKVVRANYNKLIDNAMKDSPTMVGKSRNKVEEEIGTKTMAEARLMSYTGTVAQAGGMLLNNVLTNLGETFDLGNIFKPSVIGRVALDEDKVAQYGLQAEYERALFAVEHGTKADLKQRMIAERHGEDPHTYDVVQAMGDELTKAYWGAYGNLPNYEYDVLWDEDSNKLVKFATNMIMEIFLDPTTYISVGTSAVAKSGSNVDDVADVMAKVIKSTDDAQEITAKEANKMANKAINRALRNNEDLIKSIKAVTGETIIAGKMGDGKVTALLKDLPAIGKWEAMSDRLSKAMYISHKLDTMVDSKLISAKKYYTDITKSALARATAKIDPADLGDAYKTISAMIKVRKAEEFVNGVLFSAVLPVKPVRAVAGGLKSIINAYAGDTEVVKRSATMLGRTQAKLAELMGHKEHLSITQIDEAMGIVERELYSSLGELNDTKMIEEFSNKTYKAIMKDVIDGELSILSDAADRGIDLDNIFRAISTDNTTITSIDDYISVLMKPTGTYNKSLYDIMDNTMIGKLREVKRKLHYNQVKAKLGDILTTVEFTENRVKNLSYRAVHADKLKAAARRAKLKEVKEVKNTERLEALDKLFRTSKEESTKAYRSNKVAARSIREEKKWYNKHANDMNLVATSENLADLDELTGSMLTLDDLLSFSDDVIKEVDTIKNSVAVGITSIPEETFTKQYKAVSEAAETYEEDCMRLAKEKYDAGDYRDVATFLEEGLIDVPESWDKVINAVDDFKKTMNTYVQDIRDFTKATYSDIINNKTEREIFTDITTKKLEASPYVPKHNWKAPEKSPTIAYREEVANTFVNEFTKVFKGEYKVDVADSKISEAVVNGIQRIKNEDITVMRDGITEILETPVEDMLRAYEITLRKSHLSAQYLSSNELIEATETFLKNNSATTTLLDVLPASHPISLRIQSIREQVSTFRGTRRIFEDVSNLDINARYKEAIIDSLSGEQAYINTMMRNTDLTSNSALNYLSENVTNHLIETSAEYMVQDSYQDIKLLNPYFKNEKFFTNTVDTERNITAIKDLSKKVPGVSEWLSKDADDYLDVYVSITKGGNKLQPAMITLSYGDTTKTFRNSHGLMRLEEGYSRGTFGVDKETAMLQYAEASRRVRGLPQDQFNASIRDELEIIKKLARDGDGTKEALKNRAVRFVGYDNGVMGTNQDETLKVFMRSQGIKLHTTEDSMIDIADFMRVNNGMPVFTTEVKAELRHIIDDNMNKIIGMGGRDLLSTFDNNFFSDVHESHAAMELFADTYQYERKAKALVESATNEFVQLMNSLDSVNDSFIETKKLMEATFKQGNRTVDTSSIVLLEKPLLDYARANGDNAHLTGVNVQRLVKKTLEEMNLDETFNLRKILDYNNMKAVFGDIKNTFVEMDPRDLEVLSQNTNIILAKMNSIKQPQVVLERGAEPFKKMLTTLINRQVKSPYASPHAVREAALVLDRLGDNSLAAFAAAEWYYDKYYRGNRALLSSLKKAHVPADIKYIVAEAPAVIYNTATPLFTLNTQQLYTEVFGKQTEITKMLEDVELFHGYSASIDSLELYASLREAINKAHGTVSAIEEIKELNFSKVLEPYREMVKAFEEYGLPEGVVPNSLEALRITAEHSKEVQSFKRSMRTTSDVHMAAAMETVFSLPDEDFLTYVLKDCKNTCLVDVNSNMMSDKEVRKTVLSKLEHLKNNNILNVEYGSDGMVKIYKDLTEYADMNLDDFYRDLSKRSVNYSDAYFTHRQRLFSQARTAYIERLDAGVEDALSDKHINQLRSALYKLDMPHRTQRSAVKAMKDYFPNHWVISNYGATTQETSRSLQALFPEASRLNLDNLNAYGMFDASFNCSVWADASVIRKRNLVSFYSEDIFKNMGTGMYQVRNGLEAVTNKMMLYQNPTQTLQYLLEESGITFKNYKELNNALDNAGYVLHKGIEMQDGTYKVTKVNVRNTIDFNKVMTDSSVFVSPINMYSELVQFSKGHNKALLYESAGAGTQKLLNAISWYNNKIVSARKTMWLFNSAGTWVRNYADSVIRGMLSEEGGGFLGYYKQAPELLNRYDDVYARVVATYRKGDYSDIVKFFEQHPDLTEGLSLEMMTNIFAYKASASSGGMLPSLVNSAVKNNKAKLEAAVEGLGLTSEQLEEVMTIFQKEYNSSATKVVKQPLTQKAKVKAALEAAGYEGKALTTLTDSFLSYVPVPNTFSETAKRIPGMYNIFSNKKFKLTSVDSTNKVDLKNKSMFSNALTFNANQFSAAEDYIRLSMFLYEKDHFGSTISKANREVIKAQFDYSARPYWMDSVETLFPFSTFKLFNLQYWMDTIPATPMAMRNINKLTRLTNVGYDTEEIMNIVRGQLIREKIASGDIILNDSGDVDKEESPDGIWSAMAQTIFGDDGVIATYQGQPGMYAELGGGIPLGEYHVLKVGNTYVEALSLMTSFITAIPQIMQGDVPDIFADNVYSPWWTGFKFIKAMSEADWDGDFFKQYLEKNYYDLLDTIPILGVLANKAITNMKNGYLNMTDIWAAIMNPQVKGEWLNTVQEQFYAIAGSLVPSIVGTQYDSSYYSKPIGVDWYNQTDEYKKTHRFVFGISYIHSFWSKNPATYIDWTGQLMKLGYTADEAYEMLGVLFGQEDDRPIAWQYNLPLFDEALKFLVNKGYTMSDALEVLMNEKLWGQWGVIYDGLQGFKKEAALQNSVFYAMYNRIPDYIKYTDGQYHDLREYYESLGYNEAQVDMLMIYGNGFIDEKGKFRQLTNEQAAAMSKATNDSFYEFTNGLPDWYKYEDGATSRTVSYLIDNMGMTTAQARDYILVNNFYVDAQGRVHYFTAEEMKAKQEENTKEFRAFYNTLPSFIKYEKGAYGRTLGYLKDLGYTDAKARKMIQNGAYLSLDGRLIDASGLTRTRQYNSRWKNYYRRKYRKWVKYPKRGWVTYKRRPPRPKYVKKRYVPRAYGLRPYKMRGNNSLTYSLTNIRNGSNWGTRNAFKVTLGYNTASAILSTKSNYPRTWRNISASYRRNLYKENYAKYGASRILMRAGVIRGYSNASITRLRRGEIYSNRMYRNRRSF